MKLEQRSVSFSNKSFSFICLFSVSFAAPRVQSEAGSPRAVARVREMPGGAGGAPVPARCCRVWGEEAPTDRPRPSLGRAEPPAGSPPLPGKRPVCGPNAPARPVPPAGELDHGPADTLRPPPAPSDWLRHCRPFPSPRALANREARLTRWPSGRGLQPEFFPLVDFCHWLPGPCCPVEQPPQGRRCDWLTGIAFGS